MLDTPKVHEGYCAYGEHRTWYRVTGELSNGALPLVVAHGGPGCTHDYLDAYKAIAATGRAVIHYDQLGNGRSTHLPDAPAGFWTVDLFLDELDGLLAHLGLTKGYCLLGQSWGGMLAAEHAVRRPKGLKALVIANSPSSFPTWVDEALRLRRRCREACMRLCLSTRRPKISTTRIIRRPAMCSIATMSAAWTPGRQRCPRPLTLWRLTPRCTTR